VTGLPSGWFRCDFGDVESFFDAEFYEGLEYVDARLAGLGGRVPSITPIALVNRISDLDAQAPLL